MRFYTKVANRHGGESDSYHVRVSRAGIDEVAVELTWPTKQGGAHNGELTLEPDVARWLAYALLKAVEEQDEATIAVEGGTRRP